MKYDSIRKTSRNKAIYEYYLSHPEMSQLEIAEVFSISRQRLIQILKRLDGNKGAPWRRRKPNKRKRNFGK